MLCAVSQFCVVLRQGLRVTPRVVRRVLDAILRRSYVRPGWHGHSCGQTATLTLALALALLLLLRVYRHAEVRRKPAHLAVERTLPVALGLALRHLVCGV